MLGIHDAALAIPLRRVVGPSRSSAAVVFFGAFVTLIPGVDGLIHISKLGRGKRITHPSEVLAEGQSVVVRVEKIDRDAKRISLTLLDDDEEEKAEELEDFQKYVGKAPGSFGSLGDALQKKLAEQRDQLKLPANVKDLKVENGELVFVPK